MPALPRASALAVALTVAAFAMPSHVLAAAAQKSAPSQAAKPADSSFMIMAARAGTAEMALADLANKRSQDAEVKTMADKLKADHETLATDMATLAGKKKVTLPTDLTPEQKEAANKLGKLSGPAFDKAYLDATVNDHQDALMMYTRAAKIADPDVKAFIDQALPILRDHVRQAVALKTRVR